MPKRKFLVAKPETFDDAFKWFLEYAPKFYLHQVDIKLGQTNNIRSHMSINAMRECWKRWFIPENLYDKVRFLFVVQSVYLKLERKPKKVGNLHVGWNVALVDAMHDIPVRIWLNSPSQETQSCLAPLKSTETALYFDWESLHLVTDVQHSARIHFYEPDTLRSLYTSLGVLAFKESYGHWARGHYDYCSENHIPVAVFTIYPLTDFILHHVRKLAQASLFRHLIQDVMDITISYIDVTSAEEEW